MIKIVTIYDQIQSGMGTKDDKMLPLGGKNVPIGPSVVMERYLKENESQVVACLYCGTGTYESDKKRVSEKLCTMVKKLQPDAVICGPSFNYKEYSVMCAEIGADILQTTGIPVVVAMSEDNGEVIEEYQNFLPMVRCPKKGEPGLNQTLENICKVTKALVSRDTGVSYRDYGCY